MSFSGNLRHTPAAVNGGADPRVPLLNLSTVRDRMDFLQKFLCNSVNSNTVLGKDQMDSVSAEIAAAIHQVIVNGAALIASTQTNSKSSNQIINPKSSDKQPFPESGEQNQEDGGGDSEIIEMDAVELLAEHIHFCEICGKGFKRDANLRMHMRAHGNQFKTLEALAKPVQCSQSGSNRNSLFSCPFHGCSRNKLHKKFRPLKSAICVKNHFKRSHCPKMYSCNRCNKKSFSVMADLKSHMKLCEESKWKCSCRMSFSRKDKLFGHVALFEGHIPAIEAEEAKKDAENDVNSLSDNSLWDKLLDDFGSIDNYCFQDNLFSTSPDDDHAVVTTGIDNLFGF